MKKIKLLFASLGLVMSIGLAVPVLVADSASAKSPSDTIQDGVNDVGGTGQTKLEDGIKNIVNVMLFLIGAVAVVMIIVGGIRYTISAGDSSAVSGAKNTILFAVVGLVIAIFAYAIVNFVVGSF